MVTWGFSKIQQRAMLFLLAAFGVGCVVLIYRRQQPPPPVAPALLAQLQEFSRQLKLDTVAVEVASPAAAAMGPLKKTSAAARLNLNSATPAELARLPGIGAIMAQRIIDYREQHGKFRRVEDLAQVKGIGPRKLEALKAATTVK